MTFLNEGTFTLISSVQEVHVIFEQNNLQSLAKYCFIYKSMNYIRSLHMKFEFN